MIENSMNDPEVERSVIETISKGKFQKSVSQEFSVSNEEKLLESILNHQRSIKENIELIKRMMLFFVCITALPIVAAIIWGIIQLIEMA